MSVEVNFTGTVLVLEVLEDIVLEVSEVLEVLDFLEVYLSWDLVLVPLLSWLSVTSVSWVLCPGSGFYCPCCP